MTLSRSLDHPDEATAPRDVWRAMRRGFMGRCPKCGESAMFDRYLKVSEACHVCGEVLHHHRADDAPPYVTILVVAHVIGALIFFAEERSDALPIWLVAIFWSALTTVFVLALLPRVKGALIGLQWANRMHGFGALEDAPAS